MQSAFLAGRGDVRVIDIPDPTIEQSTDAIVRVLRTGVCGSDVHRFRTAAAEEPPVSMGHEFVGVVEEVGTAVRTVRPGDVVVAPLVWSDGTCDFCRMGLHTSCRNGGLWSGADRSGAQAEAVRVPCADGTLVVAPVAEDSVLLPSLLTLSDVYGTGYHAARTARIASGSTVCVIGDGAVGLLAVLSAQQLGAHRIVLLSHHPERAELAREFGATDIVTESGQDAVDVVDDLTRGVGTQVVIEAVGHKNAFEQAIAIVRDGGIVSQIGVPKKPDHLSALVKAFDRNVALVGGLAPTRAYIEALLPAVLDGSVVPGRVFDNEVTLADIQTGYQHMADRSSLKTIVRP
ncbi:alcohol dehydrogenase catalytic domain-containing protein (plasmid) [Rhodococcus opacus]|uniref:zinc-binding dehydrogenase n=1 Tax=Rhodococcus opacus TaxID=37919 RepID=UPI0034D21080